MIEIWRYLQKIDAVLKLYLSKLTNIFIQIKNDKITLHWCASDVKLWKCDIYSIFQFKIGKLKVSDFIWDFFHFSRSARNQERSDSRTDETNHPSMDQILLSIWTKIFCNFHRQIYFTRNQERSEQMRPTILPWTKYFLQFEQKYFAIFIDKYILRGIRRDLSPTIPPWTKLGSVEKLQIDKICPHLEGKWWLEWKCHRLLPIFSLLAVP